MRRQSCCLCRQEKNKEQVSYWYILYIRYKVSTVNSQHNDPHALLLVRSCLPFATDKFPGYASSVWTARAIPPRQRGCRVSSMIQPHRIIARHDRGVQAGFELLLSSIEGKIQNSTCSRSIREAVPQSCTTCTTTTTADNGIVLRAQYELRATSYELRAV